MEIELWANGDGTCYAGDFIRAQGDIVAIKIETLLIDLQKATLLALLRVQKVKKIVKDLYEIRIKIHNVHYRFLFVVRKNKAWILEAFKKKTNKTPPRYIETALRRTVILDGQIERNLI